ncbi:hypothetical protein HPB52_017451 [Rhipicephalus sanguineus]|uniref:Reverse transcriptase zinc-binding domain-containing protein n=1 Tax=Rhipicephalus sanguineus TaxID=34632 RepID=A0A9D4PGJ1_RHISA|nr:hypothetical protein HPB52_017451 [Rhipicephalus sanguineus]
MELIVSAAGSRHNMATRKFFASVPAAAERTRPDSLSALHFCYLSCRMALSDHLHVFLELLGPPLIPQPNWKKMFRAHLEVAGLLVLRRKLFADAEEDPEMRKATRRPRRRLTLILRHRRFESNATSSQELPRESFLDYVTVLKENAVRCKLGLTYVERVRDQIIRDTTKLKFSTQKKRQERVNVAQIKSKRLAYPRGSPGPGVGLALSAVLFVMLTSFHYEARTHYGNGSVIEPYALKTTLRVLQLPEEHPARKLATYFLGVQSRLFLQTQPPGPKAINPTPFYRHVIGIYKRIAQLNLDTPFLECRNTELAQELLVNSGCEAKNPGFPWVLLTPSWLPGSIQDVVWRFGWSVLPTADRMYKWHYVRSEQCVHCHKHEDNKHALIACRVAKVFWSLVDKAYHPLGVESFVKRGRCPNGALARLVLSAGMFTLWENRGLAVKQAKAR